MKAGKVILIGLIFAIHVVAAFIGPNIAFHYTQSVLWAVLVGVLPWLIWVYTLWFGAQWIQHKRTGNELGDLQVIPSIIGILLTPLAAIWVAITLTLALIFGTI